MRPRLNKVAACAAVGCPTPDLDLQPAHAAARSPVTRSITAWACRSAASQHVTAVCRPIRLRSRVSRFGAVHTDGHARLGHAFEQRRREDRGRGSRRGQSSKCRTTSPGKSPWVRSTTSAPLAAGGTGPMSILGCGLTALMPCAHGCWGRGHRPGPHLIALDEVEAGQPEMRATSGPRLCSRARIHSSVRSSDRSPRMRRARRRSCGSSSGRRRRGARHQSRDDVIEQVDAPGRAGARRPLLVDQPVSQSRG